MVGFRSGLYRGLTSHRYRLMGVVCGSFRFMWPSSSLRECAGLFAPLIHCGIDTPRAIPTYECSVPFVPFGSWEGSWLDFTRVYVAACLHIAADSWRGLWFVAFHATV